MYLYTITKQEHIHFHSWSFLMNNADLLIYLLYKLDIGVVNTSCTICWRCVHTCTYTCS